MPQMSLFSRSEIAGMRDWSAARNHCPERDAFRREHERHRAWGLRRRHAEKLRHVRSAPPEAPAARGGPTPPAIPARDVPVRQAQAPASRAALAGQPLFGGFGLEEKKALAE